MKATKLVIRKQYEDGPSFQAERLTLQQALWFDQNDNLVKGLWNATAEEMEREILTARARNFWMQEAKENVVHGGMIASEVWKA